MATDETAPEQADDETVAESVAAARRGGALQPYREAYWEYLQALQASASEAQRRSTEAYQRYTRALQEQTTAQQNTLRRHQESYQRYVEVTRAGQPGVVSAEEGEKRQVQPEKAAETYQSFLAATQEAQQARWAFQKGQEDAYREYVNELQRIWDPTVADSVPQLRKRAYHDFLQSMQRVWSGLNLSVFDPASLAALGQDLISAAQYASAMARPTSW